MQMTLGSSFARSARKFPGKTACVDDGGSISYGDLNARVNRWAQVLTGLGLAAGSHVATLSDNRINLMEVVLGNLKQGVVTCPLDSRGTAVDVCRQAALTDSTALVFDPAYTHLAEEIRDQVEGIKLFVSFGPNPPGFARDYEELLLVAQAKEPPETVREEQEAFILFTGGTTGTPKGAVLTHKSILWNIISVTTENQSPAPEETIFYPMQMYHVASLSRFLAFMYAGGTFIGSRNFDPDHYLDMVEKHRTTFVVANPTIYRLLLEANRKRPRDTSSMRRWLNTHGLLTPDEKKEIETELWPNGAYYSSYALTEASPAVTVLKPWDQPQEWGSVGRAYMCTELRLLDPNGQVQPPGQVGEIVVRGPSLFKGYYQSPAETALALRDGWLHTGDLGRCDELGYLYLVDRLKDMIKTGGLNVYTREVEEVLLHHPGVREAAVIGLADPTWGETVCAVLVPRGESRPSQEELLAHCRAHLASYKKPTTIHWVETLPKTTFGGKVIKARLRHLFGEQN